MHAREQKRMSAHEVASYGVLTALALVLGYLEVLFPLPVSVPGVKLGLGNIVVLFALVEYGRKPALLLMLFKVVVSSLLFGNPAVFPFGLAGGLFAFAVMAIGASFKHLSVIALSMLGGIAHNLGQLVMVTLLLGPYIALANLPVLLVSGLATGLLTGIVCQMALKHFGTAAPEQS
ncbi:MAG: Gx transporter family protein [Raoultibacter sp.]